MDFKKHLLGPLATNPEQTETDKSSVPFKEQLKEFFRQQKAKLKQKKRSTIIMYVVILLAALYLIGVITSVFQTVTHLNMAVSFLNNTNSQGSAYHICLLPWEAYFCLLDIKYSIFAFLLVSLFIIYIVYWWIRNHVAMGDYTVEERGGATFKKQLQDATMGSAREMNEQEIAEHFLVMTPEELKNNNPNTLIFGKLPKSGNYLLEKQVGRFDVPNRNCFVVGDAGSWKTSNFIVTNMKQIARQGNNCVCTDSSGEVLALTYRDFIENGYDVYVINTTDTEHSDSINFIGAVGNDLDLAKTVTQTIIESTHKRTDRVDVFFEDGMKTLLPAIILLVNTELKNYSSITGIIDFILRYDTADRMTEIFETYKDSQPEAYRQFGLFNISAVKDNFISNLAQRLDLFVSSGISRICSTDGFDIIDRLGTDKKTVVFIITDNTYAFIAALFLNIISKLLVDYAKKKCEKRILPRKLYFVFEEFLTMGYIPNMGTFLSENRKFGFVYYLICQAYPQFCLRYDEREAKEIMSNCTYKFFYGTGDTDTAELFEKYCGDTTSRTAMTSYKNQILKDKDQAREGVQQRKLWDYNELLTLKLPYFILFVTHEHPLQLLKPFYKSIPGNETPDDYVEMHFSEYIPHDQRELPEKADEVPVEKQPAPTTKTSDSGNAPDSQNDNAAVPKGKPEPPQKPQNSPKFEHFGVNDKVVSEDKKSAQKSNTPRKPAKRGRPSNYDKMQEQAVVNMIEQYEELPKNRPFQNADEVNIEPTNKFMIFKDKKDRNGNFVRANKVVFDIDTTKIQVGGVIPPNEYATYNTKYNIEKLRDKMQLSLEGHLLVGFSRIRQDKAKDGRTDYMFESQSKSEHNISVPRADIMIRPIFRAINGHSPESDVNSGEYVPRHPELQKISNTQNTHQPMALNNIGL